MGDIKQWYGVPAGHAKRLEKACSTMLPLLFRENPDQMQHMTLQISPTQLAGSFLSPSLSSTTTTIFTLSYTFFCSTWCQSLSSKTRTKVICHHISNGISWWIQLWSEFHFCCCLLFTLFIPFAHLFAHFICLLVCVV